MSQIELNHLRIMADFVAYLVKGEMENLYFVAREAGDRGTIVEIGSWRGGSLIAITCGALKSGNPCPTIISIDSYENSPNIIDCGEKERDFYRMLREKRDGMIKTFEFSKYITTIHKTSKEAKDDVGNDVAMLFVDGDHSYDAVTGDIENYWDKVIPNGFVVFHDYNESLCPGVMKAVKVNIMEHDKRNNQVAGVWYCGSSIFMQKS